MASAFERFAKPKVANFLESAVDKVTDEAQLLSVVGYIRPVLQTTLPSSIASSDIEVLKKFLDAPDKFVSGGSSELQMDKAAPFGKPADQITGILKGMHDAFTADLKRVNDEETTSSTAFEALKTTKANEFYVLQGELA